MDENITSYLVLHLLLRPRPDKQRWKLPTRSLWEISSFCWLQARHFAVQLEMANSIKEEVVLDRLWELVLLRQLCS